MLALALIATLGLGGAWLWLRDSSLVGAQNVTIVGLSGPSSGPIRTALSDAAHGMSTLHVDLGRLRQAVAAYTIVRDLRVSTQFPHGMTIDVVERLPVAALLVGGRHLPLAADGTLLRGIAPSQRVGIIRSGALPAGDHVTDPRVLRTLAVLAASPAPLRPRLERAFSGPRGLTVALRSGPELYFGDVTRLEAKWAAASRVLADPGAAGAVYVDLRLPERPAAAVPGAGDKVGAGVSSALPGTGLASDTGGPTDSSSNAASSSSTSGGSPLSSSSGAGDTGGSGAGSGSGSGG
jgi:cell division protein FtsQ